MPRIDVVIYAEEDGECPFLDWLDGQPPKVQNKCLVRIERLREMGHELRRPEADTLRDGIHELRASYQGVHYRVLYFFHEGRAVLSHGVVKESSVPDTDIERAMRRRDAFAENPSRHTFRASG